MAKRCGVPERLSHPTLQMGLAFPTKCLRDPKARAEVVALLGRLLLQVARTQSEDEVHDDAS